MPISATDQATRGLDRAHTLLAHVLPIVVNP